MSKQIINTHNAPAPIGPYSQAVKANGMLFISGQVAIVPATGEVEISNIHAETHQVMQNLQAILKEANYPYLQRVTPESFGMEYLSQKCSIKTVENIDEALEHIRQYSSKHSEAIVSNNPAFCERFLNEVDAAAVYTNASTRFTDGGCFGLGAEIGISTQKLHARGPFALEKLTTEKWIVRGSGQTR